MLFDCLFIFNNTPIAAINTTSEVEPALMNGRGSPVGGIEPVMTFYCTETIFICFPSKNALMFSINKLILLCSASYVSYAL